MPATTIVNDYEKRFQRSLQKLNVPLWYAEQKNPSVNSSKQSLLSNTLVPWKIEHKEIERTPEIIHVRCPRSYRSCRSSIATSRSPSIHSWHPNHMMDGMNFSLAVPSSSSSSRRYQNYQKGIERVSQSSHWYRPVQFTTNKSSKDQTSIVEITTPHKNNHYDIPKIHNKEENVIANSNVNVEKTITNEQTNDINRSDKQQDNHIILNESQIMPLAKIEEACKQIELEEITDEEEEQKERNIHKPLISIDENLLERAANDLVESVLADILLLKTLDDDDDDDKNSGVRELSEDENGLRELDENDMNDTDEFIVFPTNSQPYTLNRLYTFSKTNLDPNNRQQNLEDSFEQCFYTSPIYNSPLEKEDYIQTDKNLSPLLTYQITEGINEETARIGRILLDSIPISSSHTPTSNQTITKNTQLIIEEQEEYDEEYNGKTRRDSAYSSNQEPINVPQTVYEPLSECYSGYSFIQSDFLTPNISSIQSTTDEAYESEPTTVCSSITTATNTHVHPELEHEFEYPSPPPPVPDRRLKPAYLKPKPLPPPTKPRLTRQENLDALGYTIIQKSKPITLSTIQQILKTSSDNSPSTSTSTRTMSSRHYCGQIPVSNELTASSENSTTNKTNEHSKDKSKDKRNSRTLNCLHPTTTDEKYFDEATNGLAIRLPAPVLNGYKENLHRISTPISTKRTNVISKTRPIIDNVKLNRPSYYETSV